MAAARWFDFYSTSTLFEREVGAWMELKLMPRYYTWFPTPKSEYENFAYEKKAIFVPPYCVSEYLRGVESIGHPQIGKDAFEYI